MQAQGKGSQCNDDATVMKPLDVIGDVHGQCDKLVALLEHLGYSRSAGAYRHRSRAAVFVGDLIDRGPKQIQTVELVRAMIEAGAARCILGNHEFNAIAWMTPDTDVPGEFLRPHGKPGNFSQHRAFLEQVGEGSARHREFIAWFRTLPLWLEDPGLRVVHACWHAESVESLRRVLGPGETLTDDLITRASRRGTWEFAAVETLCKGPEIELPKGMSFADKEGKTRHEVRIRWWQEDLSTPSSDRAAGRYEDDARCTDADRVASRSLCRPAGGVRALLVQRQTGRHLAAVCLCRLQRGAR